MTIDGLTHLTANGKWFNTKYDASGATLLKQMDEKNIDSAAIVGLPGHIENNFILEICASHPKRFLPVGSFNPSAFNSKEDLLEQLRREFKEGAFKGIKLHPRLNKYTLDNENLDVMFQEISSWEKKPIVWICSFLFFKGGLLNSHPVNMLHQVASIYSDINFVFAHGGGVNILELASAVRDCPNAFLDLSYTSTQWLGSSVEQDIKYLVNNFEKRLIFGSDFPEVSVTSAFDNMTNNILKDCKPGAFEAIMGENLSSLLNNN